MFKGWGFHFQEFSSDFFAFPAWRFVAAMSFARSCRIPFLLRWNSKNFQLGTANLHFLGWRNNQVFWRRCKTFSRLLGWYLKVKISIRTSSRKAATLYKRSPMTLFMACCKTALAQLRPIYGIIQRPEIRGVGQVSPSKCTEFHLSEARSFAVCNFHYPCGEQAALAVWDNSSPICEPLRGCRFRLQHWVHEEAVHIL